MSTPLEADVGLIHIAGGALRATPPPGVLAQSAPRRAARGRADDVLFINLSLKGASAVPPGFVDHLTRLSAECFYRTPGAVTSALREAAALINDHLAERPHETVAQPASQGDLLMAALRGSDVYIAQCGRTQAILIRLDSVTRFASSEASGRPLGSGPSAYVRFHHLQAERGDLLAMIASDKPIWSDAILASVSGLKPTQAVERLSRDAAPDLTGLLLRLVQEGQAVEGVPSFEPAIPTSQPQAHPSVRRGRGAVRRLDQGPGLIGRLRSGTAPFARIVRRGIGAVGLAATKLLVRLAPGLIEPQRPGSFPPGILAATAVAVPLVVLAVVTAVYFRRGRTAQFEAHMQRAEEAIAQAEVAADPLQARGLWSVAQESVEKAAAYGDSAERRTLADQVQRALDDLDQVHRLDFQPVLTGGFGSQALIGSLAASATDIYLLDSAQAVVWRAWATGRGFEIDGEFDCLAEPGAGAATGAPVDLALQQDPGALGTEGVVAIDRAGGLLYCAPERRSLIAQLTAPDAGFGGIQAIDVFNDVLYVLDPESNAIWVYDASGGLFSGPASLYFTEDIPDLSDAVDLAKSQEELFILHRDGGLDRCQRRAEDSGAGLQLDVECEQDIPFLDGVRVGGDAPATSISQLVYSPPPEPSLYFLDSEAAVVFQYSMRMVYQAQFWPNESLPSKVTAMAVGPTNELFLATGQRVYFAPMR